ncbi:hypothetical protein [Agromyces larvae]|uniref:Phage major capsid protein n=1 Tax=Agromyces larvae TaxID=2929802 RepID=A0ABY4C0V5_9MICO|nr:hypothetical protein [Agromyces larvae]UOE43741.1 hypothetical protein MTO99_16455 [Agromyces larvae]
MTDNLIEFEGGDVLANLDERTITGLLIPFGEEGRTNIGRFQVEASAVALPADPAVVGINRDHIRSDVVGRAVRIWEEPRGVMASFKIANTPEGDAALADPTRRKLSAEFGPAVIKAGRLVAGHAKLWGAALVPAGAFPSAQVLAADTDTVEVEGYERPAHTESSSSYSSSLDNGHEYADETTTVEDIEDLGDGKKRITRTVTTVTEITEPASAPDEDNTEGESTVTDTNTEVLAGAQPRPVAQAAGLIATTPATASPRPTEARQVFAAIAALKANPFDRDAEQVLAALADVNVSGNGSLPTGANGTASVIPPNWVGQLYQGIEYTREYIHLMTLGTDITLTGKKGYGLFRRAATTGTTEMALAATGSGSGTWAGNKTELPSHSGFTAPKTSSLRRFARGNDFAREWVDLPGGEEMVESYIRLLIEEHAYWSDQNALADIVTAAGTPVAPATALFPDDYPDALGMLIQGILAVKKRKPNNQRRDTPTFAIANEVAFAQLVYAAGGDQNLPAFVNIAVSSDRTGTVDGTVTVVQGETGIDDTASVIVGDKRAIEFDELPGGPLRIDALELAKGGIDRAVHGYLQTFEVRPEAVVLVGTADEA